MSLRSSPHFATAEKPKSVEPLRRSARIAEKAKLAHIAEKAKLARLLEKVKLAEKAVIVTPVVNPQPIVISVLDILIKYADNARGAEKENGLVTLFQYFQKNLEYIQSRPSSGGLIQIYNEKLALAKTIYPNNAELQAL